MGLIDNLVNVKISISEGVGSSASFSNILLVGIAADDATPKNIAVYEIGRASCRERVSWTV